MASLVVAAPAWAARHGRGGDPGGRFPSDPGSPGASIGIGTGGSSTATGGAGGSATSTATGGKGGRGGQGGSAVVTVYGVDPVGAGSGALNPASAANGALDPAGAAGGVSINSTSYGSARAPDVIVPGGGGMDCPTVGFGASGAGLTGGGGFGPSWISPDCNARKLSEMLWSMGYHAQAVSLLERHFPEVRQVFDEAAEQESVKKVVAAAAPAPAEPVIPASAPAFCHVPGLVLEAYPECR